MVAHLSVVEKSLVRIPEPCKYCKAASAAGALAALAAPAALSSSAAAEEAKNRKGATKRRKKVKYCGLHWNCSMLVRRCFRPWANL